MYCLGSQATVATKSVAVGTSQKRKAEVPAESPAAKQPLLELTASQQTASQGSEAPSLEAPSLGSQNDPTYHPSTFKKSDDISER